MVTDADLNTPSEVDLNGAKLRFYYFLKNYTHFQQNIFIINHHNNQSKETLNVTMFVVFSTNIRVSLWNTGKLCIMSSYNSGVAALSINWQPKHSVLNPSTSNSVILGSAGPDRNINSGATVVALIDQSINTPFWGLIYFSLLSYDCSLFCFFSRQ